MIRKNFPEKKNFPSFSINLSGWWLNQPIWKYDRQNGFIFPNFRGENKKCLKPPPSSLFTFKKKHLFLGPPISIVNLGGWSDGPSPPSSSTAPLGKLYLSPRLWCGRSNTPKWYSLIASADEGSFSTSLYWVSGHPTYNRKSLLNGHINPYCTSGLMTVPNITEIMGV